MGKASTKKNKNIYQISREELGLTREKASELLEVISVDKIEKIENGRINVHPDDVLQMSQKYKKPLICNYYCSKECAIGKQYVPEIKIQNLSQIVLQMLAALNSVQNKQQRFIEIVADEIIDDEEILDFINFQDELEKISIAVETLQLWSEKMIYEGKINKEVYTKIKNKE